MSHCIPPRQQCRQCQAEVRAAQMTEREWRRALWRFETGSKIANAAASVLCGAFVARFVYAVQHAEVARWYPWLLTEAALTTLAVIAAWWCYPKVFDWNLNSFYWDERPEYAAAKVCRELHEQGLWEAQVAVLKAVEEARGEVEKR